MLSPCKNALFFFRLPNSILAPHRESQPASRLMLCDVLTARRAADIAPRDAGIARIGRGKVEGGGGCLQVRCCGGDDRDGAVPKGFDARRPASASGTFRPTAADGTGVHTDGICGVPAALSECPRTRTLPAEPGTRCTVHSQPSHRGSGVLQNARLGRQRARTAVGRLPTLPALHPTATRHAPRPRY